MDRGCGRGSRLELAGHANAIVAHGDVLGARIDFVLRDFGIDEALAEAHNRVRAPAEQRRYGNAIET